LLLSRQLFHNCFYNFLKSGFSTKYFVVNRYIRRLDRIVLMTEAQEPGIDGCNFDLIRIFFFDSPGQSAEIRSTLSSRPIGIDRNLNHDYSAPHSFLETDKLVTGRDHFI
jgi:hypothetical protein